jgi:hypothetical protein
MLAVDIAQFNQAMELSLCFVFYNESDSASGFSFRLLSGNILFGFVSRIRMRNGNHGIGNFTGGGSMLNGRPIRSFKRAKPKAWRFEDRLLYHTTPLWRVIKR